MSDPAPPPAQPRPVWSVPSEIARLKLADVLDTAANGTDVVITWYRTPIAVVICYEDYIALRDALRAIREAHPC